MYDFRNKCINVCIYEIGITLAFTEIRSLHDACGQCCFFQLEVLDYLDREYQIRRLNCAGADGLNMLLTHIVFHSVVYDRHDLMILFYRLLFDSINFLIESDDHIFFPEVVKYEAG